MSLASTQEHGGFESPRAFTGAPEAEGGERYLTCYVKEQEYAVPLNLLREIVSSEGYTRVPNTPRWLIGVTNLRGDVLPLIDLALRLGSSPTVATARSCYVVMEVTLRGATMLVGLLMDSVGRIFELPAAAPGDRPSDGMCSRFISRTLTFEEDTVFILDVAALFSERELVSAGLIREQESMFDFDAGELPTDDQLADGGIHLFDDMDDD